MGIFVPAINLGVSSGIPFAMAFLFTKDGTKVYTGSIDNISWCAKNLPICHGMVHTYTLSDTLKRWMLFGGGEHPKLQLERVNTKDLQYNDIIFSKRPTHNCWVLYNTDTRMVYRTWRRLPSAYLTELELFKAGKLTYKSTESPESPTNSLKGELDEK